MDWEECKGAMLVKDVKADEEMIKSLIKSSKNRLESEKLLEMNEVTASSKLSLAYDSLRELLEALSLKRGYKIYNHECYAAFLKEVIGASEDGMEFDALRKLRNAVNYYGKEISAKDADDAISKIKKLAYFAKGLLENKI